MIIFGMKSIQQNAIKEDCMIPNQEAYLMLQYTYSSSIYAPDVIPYTTYLKIKAKTINSTTEKFLREV